MQQVELFYWKFIGSNLCETPEEIFPLKMEWLKIGFEQSRETEVDWNKYGPSGILSYNGSQRLEINFLPLERTMCIVALSIPALEC